jgi:hypothetical protein
VLRRLFLLASALSLLLCGATCLLWVRSYRDGYSLLRHQRQRADHQVTWMASVGSGRIVFERDDRTVVIHSNLRWMIEDFPPEFIGAYDDDGVDWRWGGRIGAFAIGRIASRLPRLNGATETVDIVEISLPFWFAAVCFALPAAIWFWTRTSYIAGHCRHRGYNLSPAIIAALSVGRRSLASNNLIRLQDKTVQSDQTSRKNDRRLSSPSISLYFPILQILRLL